MSEGLEIRIGRVGVPESALRRSLRGLGTMGYVVDSGRSEGAPSWCFHERFAVFGDRSDFHKYTLLRPDTH